MADPLIEHVLNGDPGSFRAVIRKYKDRAYTLAVSIVKNDSLARDVVQEAFIKAYTNLDTFRKEAKFSTWFYRIVVNVAYNKNKKERNNYTPLAKVSAEKIDPGVNRAFANIEEDHQRFYINKALEKLPGDYALALRLFYLEEFTLKEITRITGWTNANTRVLLHRARKKMKEQLSELTDLNKEELYR